ncbi:hypothetical protein K8Z49_37610 [Actinomadura madurae]|uniref:hypothetical protein n=1 Tax=Actinomadura madurae TaxID=1993 RepID=UPI00399B75AC
MRTKSQTPVRRAADGADRPGWGAAGRRTDTVPSSVSVPEAVNPVKRERMETLGARVIASGMDGSSARKAAAAHAERHPDRLYLQDGLQPAIAEGAGDDRSRADPRRAGWRGRSWL